MTCRILARACALLSASLWLVNVAAAAPATIGATRTYVSGTGDDSHSCSRTDPCRTFAGAIGKTLAGGEITVLDTAGYGTVTITKAITISAKGHEAGILSGGTNGVVINAGANDVVTLLGLSLDGETSGLAGIRIITAGAVHINDCLVKGFQATADTAGMMIDADPKTPIFVSDSTLFDNTSGIVLHSGRLFLDRVRIVQNKASGLRAEGRVALAQISNSTIVYNKGTGLDVANNGRIFSFRNNSIYGNGLDGKPTSALPPS